MTRPFTAADSATMVAAVHARPDVRALEAAIARAPEHWAGAEGWHGSRGRYERELRETLRRAYREALEAGGWLAPDGRP